MSYVHIHIMVGASWSVQVLVCPQSNNNKRELLDNRTERYKNTRDTDTSL